MLQNLEQSVRRRRIHDGFHDWRRGSLLLRMEGVIQEHLLRVRRERGLHAFAWWRSERRRLRPISARTIRRRKLAARFARWASIAVHRRNMQLAKDEARRGRRLAGLRGFDAHLRSRARHPSCR